jgi:hypothetical protein
MIAKVAVARLSNAPSQGPYASQSAGTALEFG